MRRRPWVEPAIAVGIPAAVFLASIRAAGIWDPYELGVADLARRAAIHLFGAQSLVLPSAENRIPTLGDLGRPELPITSIALSFKLFGLSAWAGRLPLALYGIAGLLVLWLWIRRMVSERAASYAALLLATTPLYFLHARTMLGDITTMAAATFAFAGLSVAVLDPRDDRLRWLALGVLGLVLGFDSRGGLVGVALPCLSVALAALIVRRRDPIDRGIALVLAATGVAAAALAFRGFATATTSELDRWLGAAIVRGQKFPTFDTIVRTLGHSLFPWSAFLPIAFGRLFAPPPGESGEARDRELSLRVLLVVGCGLAFGVFALLAPKTGPLPFAPVALLAASGAIVLHDYERGAHPSRAMAVACCLLAVLFFEDFDRMPEKTMAAFSIPGATFPDTFKHASLRFFEATTAIFCGALLLSLIDADDRDDADRAIPAWRRYTAWDEVSAILSELNTVWEGNLAFFAVMLEAMLVGVGALLWFGEKLRWRIALRESLSGELKILAINAWWAIPLAMLAVLFLFLTVRKLFRLAIARTRIPRAWVTAAAGIVAGAILSLGYYPALATQLSPKEVFEAYRRFHKPGEPIGLLGVAGRSIAYYGSTEGKPFGDVETAFAWLVEGDQRKFLAVRADDVAKLNSLYRAHVRSGGPATPDHDIPVLDARSSQIQLLSNVLLPGEKNENLFARIVSSEAPSPAHPLEANLDDELMALGWDVFDGNDEKRVDVVLPGRSYVLHLYYRVLAPVVGHWKSFIHIDGYGRRFNGDHEVFEGKYPMSLWQPGDYVTDRYEMKLEPNFGAGDYTLYYGFFQGEKRMAVKSGRQSENRIDGGRFPVRLAKRRCTPDASSGTRRSVGSTTDPKDERPSQVPDGSERRSADRFEVTWAVDCETEETFLYASIGNISEMGIFVRTTTPLAIGTRLTLRFSPPGMGTFTLVGQVQWVNPVRPLGENLNPGMGVRFLALTQDDRERIVEAIHTIAYLRSGCTGT